jgi:hypothetical protein
MNEELVSVIESTRNLKGHVVFQHESDLYCIYLCYAMLIIRPPMTSQLAQASHDSIMSHNISKL